ncbi:conserved exported hypothetical protein [uncultured Defluviicoccus sp.]|uniref:EF-hand domain-containing protein n=1 Tax=metagenome TaxID=256318 RepID=A0A380TFC9_9ZZZZ|nr:conserved exported hypothetical protein [uncultured Defluviicoccus sp.]
MMKCISTRAFTASALALIAACGGCGGGGDASAPPPAPATQVPISSSNQTAVARSVVSGGVALTLAQPLAAPGRATAQSVAGSASPMAGSALQAIAQRMVRLTLAHRQAPQRAQPLAASTDTEACSAGGSIATTFDDRDNNGDVSAGDVLTAAFAQCRETDDSRLDGTVVLRVTAVPANTATRVELRGSMSFQQLGAAFGGTTATLAGSVDFSAAVTESAVQMAMTVGADALRIGASSPGYSESVTYESGMRVTVGQALTGTQATTFTLDGSFSSQSLGGRITVSTPRAMTQVPTDDYPASGQIVATGAGGSQLRITVLDAAQLRLELDANGDGTFEASQAVAWSSLAPN